MTHTLAVRLEACGRLMLKVATAVARRALLMHRTRRIQPKKGTGEWSPKLVGKVAGYPATPEAYHRHKAQLNANTAKARADGTLTRTGIPNLRVNVPD